MDGTSEPGGPADLPPTEPGAEPMAEYLSADPVGGPRRGGRRTALLAAAGVGVLALGGAGAWGLSSFLSSGPSAAEAVPASALAYLALDLDPGADQKLEAYQTLRKFPALKDTLGLNGSEDLRRWLYEGLVSGSGCDSLDYDTDVAPWLGSTLAVAVMPGSGTTVIPFGVVEVRDQDKAVAGLKALAACDGADATVPATDFVDDFMVIAETPVKARQVAASAKSSSLAEDDAFKTWVDEAGGDGIITGYVSADAPQAALDAAKGDIGDMGDGMGDMGDPMGMMGMPFFGGSGLRDLEDALASFEGAALSVRFQDGALQATAVSRLPDGQDLIGSGDSGISDLPGTTAVALGLPTGDGWAQDLMDTLKQQLGDDEYQSMLEAAESESGLTLPDDLEALTGNGVSLALDSSVDFSSVFSSREFPVLPFGIRINGDPAEVRPVLDRILALAGPLSEGIHAANGEGAVAVGLDEDWVAALAGDGDLGGQEPFKKALGSPENGSAAMFVGFDTDDWAARILRDSGAGADELDNLEPLDAFGFSGHVDGDVSSVVLRITTD